MNLTHLTLDKEKNKNQWSTLARLDPYFKGELHESEKALAHREGQYHRLRVCIATEPPGRPRPHGPFERAQNSIRLYKFPNPALVRVLFDPHSRSVGHHMLLEVLIPGFVFGFGVRVIQATDLIRTTTNRSREKEWGYSYRIFKEHTEIADLHLEVCKNYDTGRVYFEITSKLMSDNLTDPFWRWFCKIFGGFLQNHFARSSLRKIKEITIHQTMKPNNF